MGLRTWLGLKPARTSKRRRISLDGGDAEIAAVVAFCQTLRDRDCVAFGSAPNPQPIDAESGPVICCNGSPFSLFKLSNRQPDFTFIHSHALARWNSSDREVRQALRGLPSLGKVVVLDSPAYTYTTEFLQPLTSELMTADWDLRHKLVEDLLGARLPFLSISTGLLSIACALRAGARSVTLSGFSIDAKGHSYNEKERYRNHVRSDVALLALLRQAGFDIRSADPAISMVLNDKIR